MQDSHTEMLKRKFLVSLETQLCYVVFVKSCLVRRHVMFCWKQTHERSRDDGKEYKKNHGQ